MQFDSNAVKSITEICKCSMVDGVTEDSVVEMVVDDQKQVNIATNKYP